MTAARQIANALYGLWLLAKFDLRAWSYFEKTLSGFWASFLVAAALAPFYFAHTIFLFDDRKPQLAFVPYLVVQALTYVVVWAIFPFAMMYVVQLLQRTPRYYWHMVPYNWMQLPLGLVHYGAWLLADARLLPVRAAVYVELSALLILSIYGTFVAGVGLQIGAGTALSLVVLDIVLGLITSQLIARI